MLTESMIVAEWSIQQYSSVFIRENWQTEYLFAKERRFLNRFPTLIINKAEEFCALTIRAQTAVALRLRPV